MLLRDVDELIRSECSYCLPADGSKDSGLQGLHELHPQNLRWFCAKPSPSHVWCPWCKEAPCEHSRAPAQPQLTLMLQVCNSDLSRRPPSFCQDQQQVWGLGDERHTFLEAVCTLWAICWQLTSSDLISTHLSILPNNEDGTIQKLTALRYGVHFFKTFIDEFSGGKLDLSACVGWFWLCGLLLANFLLTMPRVSQIEEMFI